jgi:hypothetical protein
MSPRRRSLVRSAARTAVIAGTATAASGHVAHRQQKRFAKEMIADPPRHTVPHPGAEGAEIVDHLQRLSEMRDAGALNDKEFALAKTKLLKG